jgi:hypothetical protein
MADLSGQADTLCEGALMTREPGSTISEKLGASAGMWSVLWILIHYFILRTAAADPTLPGAEYVRLLLDERMKWEWATALRIMGGLMIIWFSGSLASRLRLAEGEPGRLASIAFGLGVLWGSIWVLSAMFNSVAILLGTQYQNVEAARLTGVLGREIVLILTPSVVFVLALAVSFVAFRFGGFPEGYKYATGVFSIVILALAVADWYGPGTLAPTIMLLALAWTAVTSALLVPTYRPADMIRGSR